MRPEDDDLCGEALMSEILSGLDDVLEDEPDLRFIVEKERTDRHDE